MTVTTRSTRQDRNPGGCFFIVSSQEVSLLKLSISYDVE